MRSTLPAELQVLPKTFHACLLSPQPAFETVYDLDRYRSAAHGQHVTLHRPENRSALTRRELSMQAQADWSGSQETIIVTTIEKSANAVPLVDKEKHGKGNERACAYGAVLVANAVSAFAPSV
jgi:hypothetical protein